MTIGGEARSACTDALQRSEMIFRTIENATPPPQWVPWDIDHNWRYVEKLPIQALVQKLARQISGVRTLDLLLANGFLQEVGLLFRTLDEIGEDVAFISLGLLTSNWTRKHVKYLDYFWSESDHEAHCPVRRKDIRAFVNRAVGQPDPSTADRVGRLIYKTYSDFAHARSAPIMAMVSGPPAKFHLTGIRAAQAVWPYLEQMPSYFYRCLASAVMIAKVCPSDIAETNAFESMREFEVTYEALLFPKASRSSGGTTLNRSP